MNELDTVYCDTVSGLIDNLIRLGCETVGRSDSRGSVYFHFVSPRGIPFSIRYSDHPAGMSDKPRPASRRAYTYTAAPGVTAAAVLADLDRAVSDATAHQRRIDRDRMLSAALAHAKNAYIAARIQAGVSRTQVMKSIKAFNALPILERIEAIEGATHE